MGARQGDDGGCVEPLDAGCRTDTELREMRSGRAGPELARGEAALLVDMPTGRPELRVHLGGQDRAEFGMAAFEVKLCFQCQAEALKPHQLRDRWAWKCPSCHDQTLMSEWDGVMASFLRNAQMDGSWEPIGGLEDLQARPFANFALWTLSFCPFEGVTPFLSFGHFSMLPAWEAGHRHGPEMHIITHISIRVLRALI